jgi:hypothetical protein
LEKEIKRRKTMNIKQLLIASAVGGLISTLLVNTPFVNLINLLVCAGFWIGPIAAVWLYRHMSETLTFSQAMLIGLLAGAWHGLFGLLHMAQTIVPAQDLPDLETGLTGIGGILFNLGGVLFDLIFGFIGGLVGGLIFSRSQRRVAA